MNRHAKLAVAGAYQPEILLGTLLEMLARHPDLPLVFHYEGHEIEAGYHVTEVKAGRFASLDCGANPEAWSETFIQLWDIPEEGKTHMLASKFAAILGKVETSLGLDRQAKLTFEVSDSARPMMLMRAAVPRVEGEGLHVDLIPRAASCKPRDRWLESPLAAATATIAAATVGGCCGGPAPVPGQSACCGG